MKKEKVILSFIATLIGLLVAGIAFYIYEVPKTITPPNIKTVSIVSPSPTITPSIFLNLNEPKDEDVVNKKIITVSGKTIADATVVILTDTSQEVVSPSIDGAFSTTINIENGQNFIEISAIAPNGESTRLTRTVTYSTEEF